MDGWIFVSLCESDRSSVYIRQLYDLYDSITDRHTLREKNLILNI